MIVPYNICRNLQLNFLERLAYCRDILGQRSVEPREPESVESMMLRLTGVDITQCPKCKRGKLRQTQCVLGNKVIHGAGDGPPGLRSQTWLCVPKASILSIEGYHCAL